MYWNDVSFLQTSELSLKILSAMNMHMLPLTPKQISALTKIARSNVSTKLIELRERKLVECITPERRKGRLYRLTKKGKYVIRMVERARSLTTKLI